MKLDVKLFATLRERAGTDSISVDISDSATVGQLTAQIAEKYPALQEVVERSLVAVNQEFAFPDETISVGDEVAIFPPVSGGVESNTYPEYFAITSDKLDIDWIVAHITRPDVGAVCVFSGAVRGVTKKPDQPLDTEYLEYEAYTPMAEQKLRQVAMEMRERFPKVIGIAAVQRIGRLDVGETTVLIACSSGHRNDGIFEAAHYGIDRLKEIVPVWKKEVGPDGTEWVEGGYHPTVEDVRRTEKDK